MVLFKRTVLFSSFWPSTFTDRSLSVVSRLFIKRLLLTLIHDRPHWSTVEYLRPEQFSFYMVKILHYRDKNESWNSYFKSLMLDLLKWNNSFNSGCYRWKIQFYGYSSFRNMLRVESRNHSKQFIIYAANGNVGWYSFVPNITALYNIYYNMVSWFYFVKNCSIRSPKCSTRP